jgi:glucose-1-phosphate thymidylyltransferase
MKGIILAGGNGSRLSPLTLGVSKQLMPVYDKPMIYYPLSTLMSAGIKEILIVTKLEDQISFKRLLGDGSQLGIRLSYAIQDKPRGLADAIIVADEFIGDCPVALILGDNLFYGSGLGRQLEDKSTISGASIYAYWVAEPSAYGVVEFDKHGRAISLVEKPKNPKSNFVVPGLYFYDSTVSRRARSLSPSTRGELEITDLNLTYLKDGLLQVEVLPRGTAWLDTGSFDALAEASDFIRTIEKRQGLKVGSPEEIAWRKGFIDDASFLSLASTFGSSGYGAALESAYKQGKDAGSAWKE